MGYSESRSTSHLAVVEDPIIEGESSLVDSGGWPFPELDYDFDPSKSRRSYLRVRDSDHEYLDLDGFGGARPLGINHKKFSSAAARQILKKLEGKSVLDGTEPALHDAVDALKSTAFVDEDVTLLPTATWEEAVLQAVGCALKASGAEQRVLVFSQAHARLLDGMLLGEPYPYPSGDSASDIARLEEIIITERPAAVLVESMPLDDGAWLSTPFMESLRRICRRASSVLIWDERHSGFGATGLWWDCQYHGVKPDILIFGGRLPVPGFAVWGDEKLTGFAREAVGAPDGLELYRCFAAQQAAEIIAHDGILKHVRVLGEYLKRLIDEAAEAFPVITHVEARGLVARLEVASQLERDRVINSCAQQHLLVGALGERWIAMRPSLDIEADAIGRCGAQLEAALHRAYGPGDGS